jgi:hypothetical protein
MSLTLEFLAEVTGRVPKYFPIQFSDFTRWY